MKESRVKGLNEEAKRRTLELVRADPDGTRVELLGSLMDILVWTFLGCPRDVVETGTGREQVKKKVVALFAGSDIHGREVGMPLASKKGSTQISRR